MKMMSNRKLVIIRYHYVGLSAALEDKIRDLQIFTECRKGRRIRKKYRKRYRVYIDVHHQYCLRYSYAACLHSESFPNTKKARLRTLNKYHWKNPKYSEREIIYLCEE